MKAMRYAAKAACTSRASLGANACAAGPVAAGERASRLAMSRSTTSAWGVVMPALLLAAAR